MIEMMSTGVIVGEALRSLNTSQFDTTKSNASVSLGFGQVCRTAGQEMMITGGDMLLMLFIL